jgi:hypothetical protein
VLSRGKVTPATVSYYSDDVAGGLEDYYAGRGEAAGSWVGQGAVAEGLSGQVAPTSWPGCSTPPIPPPAGPWGRATRCGPRPIGSRAGT